MPNVDGGTEVWVTNGWHSSWLIRKDPFNLLLLKDASGSNYFGGVRKSKIWRHCFWVVVSILWDSSTLRRSLKEMLKIEISQKPFAEWEGMICWYHFYSFLYMRGPHAPSLWPSAGSQPVRNQAAEVVGECAQSAICGNSACIYGMQNHPPPISADPPNWKS